jgi:hypothetical protein
MDTPLARSPWPFRNGPRSRYILECFVFQKRSKGHAVTAPEPATIFNDLTDELTALEERQPIAELELKRLARKAEGMKRDVPDAYYMFVGMIDSVRRDVESLHRNFDRALQLSKGNGSSISRNYLLALIMAGDYQGMLELTKKNWGWYRSDLDFQHSLFRILLEIGAMETAAELVRSWCSEIEPREGDALSRLGLRAYWGNTDAGPAKSFAGALEFQNWSARIGLPETEVVRSVQEFRASLSCRRVVFRWRPTFVMDESIPSLSYAAAFADDPIEDLVRQELEVFDRLSGMELPAVDEGWVVFGLES